MKPDQETLLNSIEHHVQKLFADVDTRLLIYHNYLHTASVAKHAGEIAAHYDLSDDEIFEVMAAAWFHDTGHLRGLLEHHEEKSASLATAYLADKGCRTKTVQAVERCILATRMPAHPLSLMEQILCDADTYHLGTPDFFVKNEQVWDELELRLGKKISNRVAKSIGFLESHQYFTGYCQQLLLPGKQENIRTLKEMP